MSHIIRASIRPLSILIGVLLLSGSVAAAPFDGRPKILLHVTNPTIKNVCSYGQLSDCSNANTAGQLYPGSFHYVYLLVARGNLAGVVGLQLGLAYENGCPAGQADQTGLDIYGWTLCGLLEFRSPTGPAWPAPGSGNLVTWTCQTGATAVAGYFYVGAYSTDTLQVTARPADHVAKVANCQSVEYILENREMGSAAFTAGALTSGCNPCNRNCPDPAPPTGVCPPQPPPPPPPPDQTAAKLLLHVRAVTSKNSCASGMLTDCSIAVPRGDLAVIGSGPYKYVYLLAAKGELLTLGGIQCGIGYENNQPEDIANLHGVDVFSWTHCASLEFPTPGSNAWPAPGGGNLITWSAAFCQTGATAVAGYFYMAAYSTDMMRLTPRPVDGAAKVATCSSVETVLPQANLGYAAFSPGATVNGCNPCVMNCSEPVPVQPTTWSGVKALFRR